MPASLGPERSKDNHENKHAVLFVPFIRSARGIPGSRPLAGCSKHAHSIRRTRRAEPCFRAGRHGGTRGSAETLSTWVYSLYMTVIYWVSHELWAKPPTSANCTFTVIVFLDFLDFFGLFGTFLSFLKYSYFFKSVGTVSTP